MSENKADLFKPIYAMHVGPSPVVIRAVVTDNRDYVAGGMPQASLKAESYVLLSALPKELQERVKTAVQSIISGM
jgi:hypothetical protein